MKPLKATFKVLHKATVREGLDKDSNKIGEFHKGDVIEVVQECVNSKGLRVLETITSPKGASAGGWLKVESGKGKVLLKQVLDAGKDTAVPATDTGTADVATLSKSIEDWLGADSTDDTITIMEKNLVESVGDLVFLAEGAQALEDLGLSSATSNRIWLRLEPLLDVARDSVWVGSPEARF